MPGKFINPLNRSISVVTIVLTASAGAVATQPASTPAEKSSASAQVEIHVPSVDGLVRAAQQSHTAFIVASLAGLIAPPHAESDEDFDFESLLRIAGELSRWPDTPLSMAVYSQDRDGRPRWSVRTTWPYDDLRARLGRLLEREEVQKLAKGLRLLAVDEGSCKLELADQALAYLRPSEGGSLILSTPDLTPPDKVFGEKTETPRVESARRSLLYCRLNLQAGEDEDRPRGLLGEISMFSDVQYAVSVNADGQWSERLNLRWNPLLGMALKSALKKVARPLESPSESLFAAVVNLSMAEGLADAVAGLPAGTIDARVGSEMAFSVLPGTGFLPLPDLIYQFRARSAEGIVKAIRREIKKQARSRAEDDKPPLWHEETMDGQLVFWKDDQVDTAGGLTLVSYRTAVMVVAGDAESSEKGPMLVIVETPTPVEDFVERWNQMRARRESWAPLPSDKKSSWEARLRWKELYATLGPAVSVLGSISGESAPPPSIEELSPHLPDSLIHLKIEYAGLDVRHVGPVPFGVVYVPAVTALSIADTGAAFSEAQRERVACRNLRVLHHHAKLFQKDYGRWPANVAELDGYVDFQSHPELLHLRRKDDGFAAGLVSMFTSRPPKVRREEGETVLDDSLYVIEGEGADWRLGFKPNQFQSYQTIQIDAAGEIHRVAKEEQS